MMNMKISLIAFFLFLSITNNGYASFEISKNGSRSRAMGLAYVGLADSPDAVFINCAGLSQIAQTSFNLYYAHPFGMKEITTGAFAAAVPLKVGHFAAGFSSFGNEIYREQTTMFAYSNSVRDKLSFGINLHYMKLQINEYGSNFSLQIDIGFLVKLNEKFQWGISATNVNRAKIGESNEQLPQTISSGFSLKPSPDLIFNMDIFKDIDYPAELRLGIEYQIFNRIALRTGLTTQPENFCAGLGFIFSLFQIEYAVATHSDLGLTHQFGVQFQLNARK